MCHTFAEKNIDACFVFFAIFKWIFLTGFKTVSQIYFLSKFSDFLKIKFVIFDLPSRNYKKKAFHN
jgi:hypothetical protein